MITLSNKHEGASNSEQGSALVYILIAIALLAALTVSFMEPSSQQTSSQNSFKTVTGVQGQIDTIRSTIQECILLYPQGDRCINGDAASYCTTSATTDIGAKENFPINPDSDHYANATPAQSGDRLVANLRCPGNNGGENADHDDHELIFGGSSGKFLPPPADLFEPWQYYNGEDGVYFWTESSKSDAFILSALENLDEKFSECEADVIDASSAAVNLDSAGPPADTQCAAGSVCFRVWMLTNDSAVYGGDTDGDEASCP